MPAYALRQWQTEEKQFTLPEDISEIIDGCQDVCDSAKKKLKQFLLEERIQSIFEMDYPLRKAYEEYLQIDAGIRRTNGYTLNEKRIGMLEKQILLSFNVSLYLFES